MRKSLATFFVAATVPFFALANKPDPSSSVTSSAPAFFSFPHPVEMEESLISMSAPSFINKAQGLHFSDLLFESNQINMIRHEYSFFENQFEQINNHKIFQNETPEAESNAKEVTSKNADSGAPSVFNATVVNTSVPEPKPYALMFTGLAAVAFIARRRRQI